MARLGLPVREAPTPYNIEPLFKIIELMPNSWAAIQALRVALRVTDSEDKGTLIRLFRLATTQLDNEVVRDVFLDTTCHFTIAGESLPLSPIQEVALSEFLDSVVTNGISYVRANPALLLQLDDTIARINKE